VLFFAIQTLSHWSELENIFTTSGDSVAILRKVVLFAVDAGKTSVDNVLEVANFAIFVGKRSIFYVKSRSYYDSYLTTQHR